VWRNHNLTLSIAIDYTVLSHWVTRGRDGLVRYLVLAALAVMLLAGCSNGDDGDSDADGGTAGAPPVERTASAEADELFRKGLAALDQTQSLRYETNFYDQDGTLTSTNLDEQVRPDRAHRVITDHVAGTTVDARIVGTRVVQIQPDGQELTADAPPEEAFSYPGTWQKEFGTLSGFAIIREETFEGRNAVVIAQTAPSVDVPGALDEQLIWIDRGSGRILRWDTNQYTGEGDDRTLTARSESSLWEYDQDVTVELP
jgi:hypothetical protein